MGPFASNSITKHEYIGRRTVQPSNGGVQTTPIGGIPVWGGVPTWLEGCTTPNGVVDNSLSICYFTLPRRGCGCNLRCCFGVVCICLLLFYVVFVCWQHYGQGNSYQPRKTFNGDGLHRYRLLVKFVEHNQNYYQKLDVSTSVRAFIRRSWYSVLPVLDTTVRRRVKIQETGRMRGSFGSCLHHGSWLVVLPFGCVWPLWSIW